uniref:Alpha-(1,6)-fucosyltransferase n=1 Tax=Schistocephalus solidus TaxID=70667 RepID=A0A0X3NUV4_SCHSO
MKMISRVRLLVPGLLFLFTTIYIYIFLLTNIKPTARTVRVAPTLDDVLQSSQRHRHSYGHLPPAEGVNRSALLGLSRQLLQRRALRFVHESRYLIGSKLRKWKTEKTLPPGEELLLERFEELSRYLEATIEGLARVDGASAAKKLALQELGESLQSKLHALQHPTDCKRAKFLVMDINKRCGFGCQIHHVVHCFVLAYATNRTLLLSNSKWSYSNHGFSSVFEDFSSCRATAAGSTVVWGSASFGSARAVFCPIVEHVHPLPAYAHPAVPAAFADRLSQLHGAPHVWFVGQLLSYVMRPRGGQESAQLQQVLASMRGDQRKDIVVGLHVRRTDKIQSEASFHALDEYMFYVEEYFKKREAEQLLMRRKDEWLDDDTELPEEQSSSSSIKRRVLITTDDASIFEEARRKYPDYEFIGDSQRAKSAELSSRYTHDALVAVITDVVALSHTDYLVCTFSSQICRLAYELMQTRVTRLGDASACFQSLDDVYYYGGQQAWPYEVIIPDSRSGLKVGDLVAFHGNHWDGLAKVSVATAGSSRLSEEALLVPAYKFQQRLLSVPFGPSFKPAATPPSPSRTSLKLPAA